jgi:hypothetical protein
VLGRMTLENEILKKQWADTELDLRRFAIASLQVGQE